jgi:hypothetical protein
MSLNSPLESLQRTPSISQLGRAPSFKSLGGSALSRTTSLSGFGRTTSAASNHGGARVGGIGRTVSAERSHGGVPPPLPKETFQEGDFVTISAHENEAYVGMTGRVLSPEPRQRRIEVEVFLEGDSEGRKVRGSPLSQNCTMARVLKDPQPYPAHPKPLSRKSCTAGCNATEAGKSQAPGGRRGAPEVVEGAGEDGGS